MRRGPPILLGALACLCATAAGARPTRIDRFGLGLTLAPGWHAAAAPGQLQAADFPLRGRALASAQSVRVPRGHVHLVIWDYGPQVPYLRGFRAARPPLALRRSDVTPGPLEGFRGDDAFALRTLELRGELLEVIADLGPKPLRVKRLRAVNRVLATLRVRPPRIRPARRGKLAWGGVGLRLVAGWTGRIELPASTHAAQLVVRARRRGVALALLELPLAGGGAGHYEHLPIRLTRADVLRWRPALVARRVFSNGGRSFDLSVSASSAAGLAAANRVLATLRVRPRVWTFRTCDLTLRLPGTWRAAVNPRSNCYPVITLRGSGARVVLTELRPRDAAVGRVVVRAGRRFRVAVAPERARAAADAIVATLRAAPRRRAR